MCVCVCVFVYVCVCDLTADYKMIIYHIKT